jgi:2-polyprenyl-3-methyl-5-hydroxy-6-metoxy-1,4-benzoquinol methylase
MNNSIYEVYGDFLSGKRLHVGWRFKDLSVPAIADRMAYIRAICRGKKVLHIGCLDHEEILFSKVKNKSWLHGIVTEAAELCVGVDVNHAAYDRVRRELGLDNIRLLDLSQDSRSDDLESLTKVDWDLILCPEILEHITNHRQFLENLYNIASPATKLIITVPNAFSVANFINTLRRFEAVNSDHRYWFTSYTLCHLLVDHGWRPSEIIYYGNHKSRFWLRMSCRLAGRLSRGFADGLIVAAEKAVTIEERRLASTMSTSLVDAAV